MALKKDYMGLYLRNKVFTDDPSVTPESRLKLFGDAITEYILSQLEVTWVWSGVHKDTGTPDPVTILNGKCSFYKMNLSPGNSFDIQENYNHLANTITAHTRIGCKLKVTSGYWSGNDPIKCVDFPDLVLPVSTMFANSNNTLDSMHYFEAISDTIIKHFHAYHPATVITGERSKHVGSTSLCTLL